MNKNSKILMIIFLILIPVFVILVNPNKDEIIVRQVISSKEILLLNGEKFTLDNYATFDSFYSENNRKLSIKLGISEDEAFILGNLGKYWTSGLILSQKVKIDDSNLIYYKFDYKTKFVNSPFCIENDKPCNEKAYKRQLNSIRKGHFIIVDMDNDTVYSISKSHANNIKNYVVVKRSHVKSLFKKSYKKEYKKLPNADSFNWNSTLDIGNTKVILSDLTTKLFPDRKCSSDICKEILTNINSASKTIDIAIYGYSSTPEIETAIISAQKRGVKIRLVYDVDSAGKNIYPNTFEFVRLISENLSDKVSKESANTMHNKFYVFDNKIVITGSANLSHTDMSGYNSNSIIVIKSPKIAKFYTEEFEQMLNGKFHNDKVSFPQKTYENIEVYFSPQDKIITNVILPLIKSAKEYIYIPAFIITEKRMSEELISAHKRGVDVKIIVDSLNAFNSHSKHNELRNSNIPVKAENYAGKMHSKTIIIDDKYLLIGSMNFSKSGENKNDENLVVLKNPDAAKFYKKFFLYQWKRIPEYWLIHTPRAEGIDSLGSCTDGIDNNYDGLTDKEDPACKK